MPLKEYLVSLTSANSTISSKRVISLFASLLLFACTIVNFWGIKVQPEIIYALVSVILGSSAMTLASAKTSNDENGDIIKTPSI